MIKSYVGFISVQEIFKDMCTHFYLQYQSQELKDIIQAAVDSKLANRLVHERAKAVKTYGEIKPTDIVPVIAPNSKGTRAVFPMQWGFHLPKSDKPLVNARCETAATKPTFKDAWQSHRCIIPASYYSDHKEGPFGRIPYDALAASVFKRNTKYFLHILSGNIPRALMER